MKHLIWLASYPKSGNTWLRILLDSILHHQGEPVNINQINTAGLGITRRQYFDEFLEFDSGELSMSETNFFKRKYYLQFGFDAVEDIFIKTHEANVMVGDREHLIPEEVTKLCIYIVRNPLDIVGSLASHYHVGIDKAIEIMGNNQFTSFRPKEGITSNVPEFIGDWSLNVKSWLNSKELPLILVKYEELLDQPIETLSKILSALNLPVIKTILQRALVNHNFTRLANQEKDQGFREKIVDSRGFFRKGKSGSWKEELTQRQIQRVVNTHHEVMVKLNYTGFIKD